jgi:8-oxo-dGTP pyrophosphatase MutT (NUDIX family)
MPLWKKIKQRTLLAHSKFLRVDEHEVALPDGTVIPDWPVVVTPDYVNILARDTEGRFLFFRQKKYMAPHMRISPPGGYIDSGEDPLSAARRELQEETGYTSDRWVDLGCFVVDSNRGCGNAFLFLALDARLATHRLADDLEEQELIFLTRTEVEAALDAHACPILSATALMALGLRWIDSEHHSRDRSP